MSRYLKTFLLWMLILVLPAQAMASVVKASCGVRHITTASSTMAPHSHDGMLADHEHDHDAVVNADKNDEEAEVSAGPDGFKSSFCNACASCCVGVGALPTFQSWTPTSSGIFANTLPLLMSFTDYIPAGLERPPRSA